MLGDAVGGFRGERDEARAGHRQERGAVAAVDVAAAVGLDRLVAGDRMQVEAVEAPAQAGIGAELRQILRVLAVDGDLVAVEAGDRLVGAGLDHVGAEQAGGAVQVARVHVEQRIEAVAGVSQLGAGGEFGVALVGVVFAGVGVVDEVVAVLVQAGQTGRPALAQAAADGAFGVDAAVGGDRDLAVTGHVLTRLDRVELDHAGRRVAAEQGALRTAQQFHLLDVEHREAFQDRVFLHHVVVHQRHRLRGVQAEVGVAVAADVEAREGAAERGFDVQARGAVGQEAHVGAAGGQHVEVLAADRADRNRNVLQVLDAAVGGDLHFIEHDRVLRGGDRSENGGGNRRGKHMLAELLGCHGSL